MIIKTSVRLINKIGLNSLIIYFERLQLSQYQVLYLTVCIILFEVFEIFYNSFLIRLCNPERKQSQLCRICSANNYILITTNSNIMFHTNLLHLSVFGLSLDFFNFILLITAVKTNRIRCF